MKQILKPEDLSWVGVRFLDAHTRTFLHDGAYHKAVLPQAEKFVRRLFDSGIMAGLTERGLLARTEISGVEVEGFPLTLRQDTEHFNVKPKQFVPQMIQDAARTYLDINSFLLEHKLGLVDGHARNFVVQDNCVPRWCDIGSIAPVEGNQAMGLDEFVRFFVYPLLLRQKNHVLAELSLHYFDTGMRHDEAEALLGRSIRVEGHDRARAIALLKEIVGSLSFGFKQTTWTGYHNETDFDMSDPDVTSFKQLGNRVAVLKRLMKTLKPRTVVDFGANAGFFSLIPAKLGAQVMAYEIDESAASKCYLNFREQPADLKVKVGLGGFAYDGADNKPDLVLALALTHHLYFTHQYRFEVIARILSEATTSCAMVEFMPNALGTGKPHISPLPEDYTLECMSASLGRFFSQVDVVTYGSYTNRILLVARR